MTPEKHTIFTKRALAVGEPKDLAANLRQQYIHCSDMFRQIVACVPGFAWQGHVHSADIRLGETDTDQGKVLNVAKVALTSFDPTNPTRTGFSATTMFESLVTATNTRVETCREKFGTLAIGFSAGLMVPAFVRNPNTSVDEPWDHAFTGYRYPLETDWSKQNYGHIAEAVYPMIETAQDTITMLVTALQDEKLNGPQVAARAASLTLPSAVTV